MAVTVWAQASGMILFPSRGEAGGTGSLLLAAVSPRFLWDTGGKIPEPQRDIWPETSSHRAFQAGSGRDPGMSVDSKEVRVAPP